MITRCRILLAGLLLVWGLFFGCSEPPPAEPVVRPDATASEARAPGAITMPKDRGDDDEPGVPRGEVASSREPISRPAPEAAVPTTAPATADVPVAAVPTSSPTRVSGTTREPAPGTLEPARPSMPPPPPEPIPPPESPPASVTPAVPETTNRVIAVAGKPGATRIGTEKCKMCHKVQHASWAESAHARQLPVLDCESCHGPGSEYKKLAVMKDAEKSREAGLVKPGKSFCTGSCHTENWQDDMLARTHAHKKETS